MTDTALTTGTSFRVSSDIAPGAAINRNEPLEVTIDGHTITAYRGDTVTSALLANGYRTVGDSIYLGRPHGVLAAGVEEPNSLVTVTRAKTDTISETMLIGPTVEVTEGMVAAHLNGIGKLADQADPEYYDYVYEHPDVLVIGAGPAGLAAARQAARAGSRVLILDERATFGGNLAGTPNAQIDGIPAEDWIAQTVAELQANDDVLVLGRNRFTGSGQALLDVSRKAHFFLEPLLLDLLFHKEGVLNRDEGEVAEGVQEFDVVGLIALPRHFRPEAEDAARFSLMKYGDDDSYAQVLQDLQTLVVSLVGLLELPCVLCEHLPQTVRLGSVEN